MLETIGNFLGGIAVYIAALLGLVALYFLWVAAREWRTSRQAAFGIERDMAASEMVGAVARAGVVVVVGIVVLAAGRLGERIEEPSSDTTPGTTRTPIPTVSVLQTLTPAPGETVPALLPTDTLEPDLTGIPALPIESTQAPDIAPTPQTATVAAFGGVWLRDAPNGGTIDVLPQGSIVEFQNGTEFAGAYNWQKVKVLSTPPGSQVLVGLEGWVAEQFLEGAP